MAIFTITSDFFKSLEEQIYITDILFVFTNRNTNFKVARDEHGHIFDIYKSQNRNVDVIKYWLELMSFSPSRFHNSESDIREIDCIETKFLKICKDTIGFNNLIVYSTQEIKKNKVEQNKIYFEGVIISVFDKDDARQTLSAKKVVYKIKKSIVGLEGGKVKKAKIKETNNVKEKN